jgi:hypothetical protein
MPQSRTEVKTYELDYACDVAGCTGVMRPTGETVIDGKPLYTHRCIVCGTRLQLDLRYPTFAYVRNSDTPFRV